MMYENMIRETKQITVTPDQIECNPLNDFAISDLDEMQNDLLLYGLITPIAIIGPSKENKFMLISGERRFTAIKNIREKDPTKFNEIAANIVGPYDMDSSLQKLLIDVSNISVREDVNLVEKRFEILKILFEMQESQGMHKKEIIKKASEFFKVSRRYARMYAHVFTDADDSLKEKVINGEIPIDKASQLSYYDQDTQKRATEMIDAGEPVKKVVDLITKKDPPIISPKENSFSKEPKEEKLLHNDLVDDEKESTILPEDSQSEQRDITTDNSATVSIDHAFKADDVFEDGNLDENDLEESDFGGDDFNYDAFVSAYDMGVHNNIDTTGAFKSLESNLSKSYSNKLNTIMEWCNAMKTKDSLTDEEWDVLACMKELVEKFF